jgi:hypothetical protein
MGVDVTGVTKGKFFKKSGLKMVFLVPKVSVTPYFRVLDRGMAHCAAGVPS